MKESHKHLNISEAEWQAMAADFRKTLDKFKVPEKEQKELFAIVESTKKDIVKASPSP
jgi:hemoglobin